MDTKIKILILEDSQSDLELLIKSIEKGLKGNFEYKHIQKEDEFTKQFIEYNPDIILSEIELPSFSCNDILLLAKDEIPNFPPLIIVSKSINEEKVINCINAGASDYVLKENLTRLPQAILAAVEKHKLIIDQKIIQEALKKSEKELMVFFNNSPVIKMIITPQRKILKINKAGLNLSGKLLDQILGKTTGFVLNCVYCQEKENCGKIPECKDCQLLNFFTECFNKKCESEFWIKTLEQGKVVNKTYIAYFDIFSEEPELTFSLSLVDISIRKNYEKQLIKSEEKYRELADALPEIVFEMDTTGRFLFLNKTVFDKYNLPNSINLNELEITNFIHTDDIGKLKNNLKRILGGEKFSGNEYKSILPDGSIGYMQIFNSPIIEGKKITGVRGIAIDITERKLMEDKLKIHHEELEEQVKARTIEIEEQAKKLKQSHKALTYLMEDVNEARKEVELSNKEIQKLSEAIEQNPSSVIITDTEGNIEYVNQQFSEITGFNVKEAIGQNPRILNSGTHPASFFDDLWKTIKSGKKWNGEICNRKKNGEIYWDFSSISPLRDSKQKIINFIAVKEDITDKKLIEQKLQEYNSELELFNKLMVDRELKIIEMKEEVNKLYHELGRDDKYSPVWANNSDSEK